MSAAAEGLVNDIERHRERLQELGPFVGYVPRGFTVDFLGRLTDERFNTIRNFNPDEVGGGNVAMRPPDPTMGEGFFEAAAWLDSAREARGSYTMITLGACYGAQAVGAYMTLQRTNPMPARLVAVEAEPTNFTWMHKHFNDNGIDPGQHWLLNCAVSDTNKPVFFPVGSPGAGVNNCISTNEEASRKIFAKQLSEGPNTTKVIYDLLVEGKTGIEVFQPPGSQYLTVVELISAVTLENILAPLHHVDLLEADMQCSEAVVFPPSMETIKRKVKLLHVGTHGADIHTMLLREFVNHGFEIIFDYKPFTHHDTLWGSFDVNDGIITARNLALA